MADISILEQRRIEAAFAAHVLRTLAAELGQARALELLGKAVIDAAHASARSFAAAKPGNENGASPPDLTDYARILPLWEQGGGIEIEWLEKGAERIAFNVTRCRYAEMYREMGLGALGETLSCNRDGEFCHGYNPAIRFERTQTIMKGASHCDFVYTLPKAPAPAARNAGE